ncbi:MAG: hypothetical protein PHG55_01465 [Verrucomicrobiota bacterium]|nr:hypothetical protein [Verrucomicrobiota bacterium]MDD8049983.1 hypothetical protein [Verrucomicrobiota bacterium]HCF94771.1 hypothetical protein [Verrucomicrobiota bacterium]
MEKLIGKIVVVDTSTSLVYMGRLREVNERWIEMEEVDLIDLGEIKISRELLLIEKKRDGLKASRGSVMLTARAIVSISVLEEIIDP